MVRRKNNAKTPEASDTFRNDRFPDLGADFIFVNPPFNVFDRGGERVRDDKCGRYGAQPATDRSVCP